MQGFTAFARSSNLSPAAAQEVLNREAGVAQHERERLAAGYEQTVNEWEVTVRNDPNLGGHHLPTTLANAAKALEGFPALQQMLSERRWDRHPEVVAFLSAVGAQRGEGTIATDGGPAPAKPLTLGDTMYPGFNEKIRRERTSG